MHSVELDIYRSVSCATVQMMMYFQEICPADDGIIEKPKWVYIFLPIGKWKLCHGNFAKHFWMKIY
jgi:hypothetical protein